MSLPRAKRVIFLFMAGGVSQVDSFDYKPLLYKRKRRDAGLYRSTHSGQNGYGIQPAGDEAPLGVQTARTKRRLGFRTVSSHGQAYRRVLHYPFHGNRRGGPTVPPPSFSTLVPPTLFVPPWAHGPPTAWARKIRTFPDLSACAVHGKRWASQLRQRLSARRLPRAPPSAVRA